MHSFGVLHLFDRKLPNVFVSNITLIGDKLNDSSIFNGNVDDGALGNETVDEITVGDGTVSNDAVFNGIDVN